MNTKEVLMENQLPIQQNAEQTYHSIRQSIVTAQLTAEFGKGFDVSNQSSKHETVLYDISNSRDTVSWIELVTLCETNENPRWNRTKLLCRRMCKIRMERTSVGTSDSHHVLSAHSKCHTHKLRFLTYNLSNYGIIISNSTPQTCYRKTQKSLSVSTGETFCFILPIRWPAKSVQPSISSKTTNTV